MTIVSLTILAIGLASFAFGFHIADIRAELKARAARRAARPGLVMAIGPDIGPATVVPRLAEITAHIPHPKAAA